ncbi:MAG: MoaD/ThiS family protein [Phycisphaerales bacterium]
MFVDVLLFGAAARELGGQQVRVRTAPAPTAAEVLRELALQHPALRRHAEAGRLAVNHAFAAPGREIREGDEVALIAFVSGG